MIGSSNGAITRGVCKLHTPNNPPPTTLTYKVSQQALTFLLAASQAKGWGSFFFCS